MPHVSDFQVYTTLEGQIAWLHGKDTTQRCLLWSGGLDSTGITVHLETLLVTQASWANSATKGLKGTCSASGLVEHPTLSACCQHCALPEAHPSTSSCPLLQFSCGIFPCPAASQRGDVWPLVTTLDIFPWHHCFKMSSEAEVQDIFMSSFEDDTQSKREHFSKACVNAERLAFPLAALSLERCKKSYW